MKTYGTRAHDCMDIAIPCDRIILDGTRFINNSATFFGSSIMITKPDNVLVGCEAKYAWTHDFMARDMILERLNQSTLKAIEPKELCKSWEDDRHLNDTSKVVIGTFAHTFTLTTNSKDGIQFVGNYNIGFILKNVESGKQLPNITITTLDAFGNTRVPALYEKKALVLNSSDQSFQRVAHCSFNNGICTIVNLITFVLRRNYTFYIYPRNYDILEATNLVVVVRGCIVDEESASEGKTCRKCGEASYNFDLSSSGKCVPCPQSANCTTRYIKPKEGYWHKGPCHAKVKKCIADEACKVKNRLDKLNTLTRGFDDCNMSDTLLLNYSKAQCHEVSILSLAQGFA